MTPSNAPAPDLPDLVALASGLAEFAPADADEAGAVLQSVLSGVRELLGMDVAFIGEFRDGQRIYRHVDGAVPEERVRVGRADPLEETYCQRVVDGRLPGLLADAARHPEAAALPVTAELPVGTLLSAPIVFSDGRIYGTFCTFSHEPDPGVRDRDLGTVRLLAALTGRYLERDANSSERRSRATSEVLEVLALGRLRTVFQPIIDLRWGRPVGWEALSRFPSGRPDEVVRPGGRGGPRSAPGAGRAGPGGAARPGAAGGGLPRGQPVARDGRLPAVPAPSGGPAPAPARPRADRADRRDVLPRPRGPGRVAARARGARRRRRRWRGLRRPRADRHHQSGHPQAGRPPHPRRRRRSRPAGDGPAMGWFAERIGAGLVAEGVEDAAELEALRGLGVAYVQGFHTGRPRTRLG